MQRMTFITFKIVLLLALGLTLSGCGGGESEESPPPPPPQVKQYSVHLSVSNLQGSIAVQLNGQSNIIVSKDGTYTFDRQLTSGSTYAVTVTTQPVYQQCAVNAGTGTIESSNITNVTISCIDQVQMTQLAQYYPASLVHFSVPATSTDNLSVTMSGSPLPIQKGIDGNYVVILPNNAVGSVELNYSIGNFTRNKAITVQPLTIPSDSKTYVATQYQNLLATTQRLRNEATNPSIYDGLISELKKNQGQLASLSADQQTTLALIFMQMTPSAAGANLFEVTSQQSEVTSSCANFVDSFIAKRTIAQVGILSGLAIMNSSNSTIQIIGRVGFTLNLRNIEQSNQTLYSNGQSCFQLTSVALESEPNNVAIVAAEFAQDFSQSVNTALMKTGTTYRYTMKPTIGFDAALAAKLSALSTDLRKKLQPFPNTEVQLVLAFLDAADKPTLKNISYQVTSDSITGVSIGINVDGNKLTVSPKISDIAKLTQSSYPTKLNVKTNIGDKVYAIDATVVVDFKPVVQSMRLQAKINQKTDSKLVAENVTTFTVVTQPTQGLLNFDSKTGAFDYTPNANTVGKTDTFTVRGTYLLGGDPNKSYSSELATVTVDVVSEEFCKEFSWKSADSAYLQIDCNYGTGDGSSATWDRYWVFKHSNGTRSYQTAHETYNSIGKMVEAEWFEDQADFGPEGPTVGDRKLTLKKVSQSFKSASVTYNEYRYWHEIDLNKKFIGVYLEEWLIENDDLSGNTLNFDRVTCYDRSWSTNKSVLYQKIINDGVSTKFIKYSSCPNTAKPEDKLQKLTKDSKAKKRFNEVFPGF